MYVRGGFFQLSDITVAIPCYNAERFIERSLRSVFAQQFVPDELIVIDDGSTDNSSSIIERVLKDCPFQGRFLSQSNKGIPKTLNRALRLCASKYFAYLGADDIWLPTFLRERVKLLESRPDAVAAYGNTYIIDENDDIFDLTSNWREFPDGDIKPLLFEGNACPNPGVVYRTDSVKKFMWNEDTFLEDYEMYLKLSTIGEIPFDERLLSAYRIHDANISRNLPRQFGAVEKSFKECQDLLGLTNEEVEHFLKSMRFKAVDSFVRSGHPRKALKLLWQNIGAADSFGRITSLLLRILTPQPMFRWNRRRKKRKAIKKFGKLEYQLRSNIDGKQPDD